MTFRTPAQWAFHSLTSISPPLTAEVETNGGVEETGELAPLVLVSGADVLAGRRPLLSR